MLRKESGAVIKYAEQLTKISMRKCIPLVCNRKSKTQCKRIFTVLFCIEIGRKYAKKCCGKM